ncbi:MAG: wax ester/triacylglycerol synthase family O-acyltransferase [Bacteroidota bacterium]
MPPRPFPVSPPDAAWLRMENPTNPMTITGILGFSAALPMEDLRRFVTERLLRFDRFQMRIEGVGSGAPRWVPDGDFSLDRHLFEVDVPAPGGKAGLERLVSELMSRPLSFDRPPWTLHLVHPDGDADLDGSALVVRLHHVIGDGVAMMHVLIHAVDEYFDPEIGSGAPPRRPKKPLTARLAKTLKGAAGETVDLLTRPSHLGGRLGAMGSGSKALAHLLAMRPDSETVFKGTVSPVKQAAWTRGLALDRIKATARGMGAKVNDVLMSAAAGALRRYLDDRGEPVEGVVVRAATPFNVRPLERAHELGNSFGLVFVELPVGEPTARARLGAMKRSMDRVKQTAEPAVVFGILQSIGRAPMWVHRKVVDLFEQKATAVMSNVPGPQEPLHFMGAPITTMMYWVPQAGNIGLGISIISLNGEVRVGVAVDAAYVDDPAALAAAFESEFDALAAEFAGPEAAAEAAQAS